MSVKQVADKAGIKNRMSGFAGSMMGLYFLVSLAEKVQVLDGWKVSWSMSKNVQQLAGLIGNRCITESGM